MYLAGPAGLTLARLLQRRAIPCRVVERDRDRSARGQGGSLDLHEGSAQVALREAGLYEAFLKHARTEGEVLKIYDPQSRILLDESKEGGGGRPDEEFKGRPEIDRVVLRDLLIDAVDAGSLAWARRLRHVTPGENQTHDLHFEDGGGTEKGYDLVIGADGAWSRVREALSSRRPFYSGVGGLDLKFTDVDQRNPRIAERVGKGMSLTLGSNRGLMAQRNGDGSARVYAFVRTPEENYSRFAARTATEPAQVKKEMLEAFYADWDPASKRLVLESDDEVYVRPMYMLPIGFNWIHKPG
jgi:2-polyprenyl-6-methoxyphenol hydroxylase-like FAD-dependent oxidoreductase